jgi:hypothetical protein
MRECEIVDTNADNIGACSFCGYKPGKNEGHRRKRDWLKQRHAEGLRYKVLRSREFGDIEMIEYAPGRQAWRPVSAEVTWSSIACGSAENTRGKGLGCSCWIVVWGTQRSAGAEESRWSPVQMMIGNAFLSALWLRRGIAGSYPCFPGGSFIWAEAVFVPWSLEPIEEPYLQVEQDCEAADEEAA